MTAALIATIAAILVPLVIVALIDRHLDRAATHDALGDFADENDRAVALSEFVPFHSATINGGE